MKVFTLMLYLSVQGSFQSSCLFDKQAEGNLKMANVRNDQYFAFILLYIYQTHRTLLGNCSPLHICRQPVFSSSLTLFCFLKNGSYLHIVSVICQNISPFHQKQVNMFMTTTTCHAELLVIRISGQYDPRLVDKTIIFGAQTYGTAVNPDWLKA